MTQAVNFFRSSSTKRAKRFARFSAFAAVAILSLALSLVLRSSSSNNSKTTVVVAPSTGQSTLMPRLEGDKAKEYLQQKGLSDSLGEAIAKARYRVRQVEQKNSNIKNAQFEAENPRNGYRAIFSADGTTALVGGKKDSWLTSMKLEKFGRGANLETIASGRWEVKENRAENRREMITEWYENKSSGLEHGFTISSKPALNANEKEQLRLAIEIGGDLRARVEDQGQTLSLGTETLRYSNLKVWDADGTKLLSRMELKDNELTILVEDSTAVYPIMIDPVFEPVKKITASDGAAGDQFGNAVAMSGDIAVVAAVEDDTTADNQGSAYIFERNKGGGDRWGEVKKITVPNTASADRFGRAVAISGDTVIIGSSDNFIGAAYIFERNAGGADNWGQVKKLTASDGVSGDNFGNSVSISGDTVVVGASTDDSLTGSAYIFERNKGGMNNWGEVKKLTASDKQMEDLFGTRVSISIDTVIVGAYADDNFKGAAYIFERNTGGADNWGEVKKLTASDGGPGDVFGFYTAISGDTVIVGANGDDLPAANQGAAYIFERNRGGANNWGEVKKLTASDGAAEDSFGYSVSISVDTVIVGAYDDDDGKGAAYIFERNTGGADNWGEVKKLTASDGASNDFFGASVSISSDTVIIGALADDGRKGSAHIFANEVIGWVEIKKNFDQNSDPNDVFGQSVSISGDTAIVGVPGDDGGKGAAYIFERNTGGANIWGEVKKIIASDGAATDSFGTSVSISGDTVIVGAESDDNLRGSAYIFSRNTGGANNWGQVKKLTASDGGAGDHFSVSVSISGDTAIVGAWGDDAPNPDQGSAYIFERNTGGANNWGEVKKLVASDGAANDEFGFSVAISVDTVIIGSHFDDAPTSNQGSAYIFARNQGGANNWGEAKKLTATDGAASDGFGYSVSISGDTAIVGAPNDDAFKGSAYVLERNKGGMNNWGEVKKLVASDGAARETFGISVSISVDTAVVGALFDEEKGAAYVFERNWGESDFWGEAKKLTASDRATDDRFGTSVSISDDTVIVGANGDESFRGASYIYNSVLEAADLSVTKMDTPDPVTTGNNLTYTIKVANDGPNIAENVSFTDTLPAGTTFVSLSGTGEGICTTPAIGAAGTVSCSINGFPPTEVVFTLVVKVALGTPNGTILSNTATISSTTYDPNPGNQSSTATTTVFNPVQMAAIPDQVGFVGQSITAQASATSTTGGVSYSLTKTDSLFPTYIDSATGYMFFQRPVQEGRNHAITVRATSGANFAERTFHVKWVFNWQGFTSPNENGSSVFSRGSATVIPVKFKLGFNATGAIAKLFVAPVNNLAAEAPARSSDGKTQFVYSAMTKDYQFNWKPFGLAAGQYRLRVDLGDGELHTVLVRLQ